MPHSLVELGDMRTKVKRVRCHQTKYICDDTKASRFTSLPNSNVDQDWLSGTVIGTLKNMVYLNPSTIFGWLYMFRQHSVVKLFNYLQKGYAITETNQMV